VIGTDVDPSRIATALENGLDVGINPKDGNLVDRVVKLTDGYGADAVIITAASASSDILARRFRPAGRRRGSSSSGTSG